MPPRRSSPCGGVQLLRSRHDPCQQIRQQFKRRTHSMFKTIKAALTALAAGFLLSTTIATASARSFSSSSQTLRATWASFEFSLAGATVRCRVTLEGSFHSRTFAKVERSSIGAVTRAISARPCTGGEVWFDNGVEPAPGGRINRLPWNLTYEAWGFTLPNIELLDFLVTRFSVVRQIGGSCTARYGNATDNLTLITKRESGGGLTTITPAVGRDRVTLVTRLGGIFCPERITLSGTGNLTVLGSASRITVTLI